MLGSALMFSVMDCVIKIISPSFRIWDIAFYRFGFGVLILYGIYGGRENLFKGSNPRLLILRGVMGSCAFLSIVSAIRLIPISTAMVLFFSFPAFTALFSPWIYKERIALSEIICVAATLLGIATLFDFRFEGLWLGQVLAVSGAAFAGLTVAIIKKLRENHRTGVVYMYFCIIGTCITFPAFIAAPQLPQSWNDGAMMAIIVVTSAIAQLLMTKGLRYCKSWEGGVLLTMELFFTSLMGILFLQETVTWRFWFGGLLILGSVMGLQICGSPKKIKSA
jgi:drug/metabolite transporter (DMT)-like permease